MSEQDYQRDRINAPPVGECIDFSDVFGVKATNTSGYGQVWFDGKLWKAHRLAWCVDGKELPPKPMILRHRCHNRRCVNVDHLEIGTHRDNARDAIAAGTLPGKVLDTLEVGRAYKLALFGMKQADIAKTLGVTTPAVSLLIRTRGKDSSDRRNRIRPGEVRNPYGRPKKYRASVNLSASLF